MLSAAETAFWICFFIIFYTYAGYPLILWLLVFIKKLLSRRKPSDTNICSPVTFVVAAYNEQDIIEEKIKNCFSLNYPVDKIKFLFITDGSDDNTVNILKKYPAIVHLHQNERKGKLAAMNRAMQYVDTDFVIFSDANTMLNREGISKIISHYADKKVGAVAGEKKVVTTEEEAVSKGEGLYWRYESLIKKLDSDLYTVVGAAGELFSLRSALYTKLPENIIIEDFVQSLMICLKGFVVRYEPGAFSEEKASVSLKDELERKIRISAGGFQAMISLKKLFNIFGNPVLWFQYISHRVLRWTLCPVALLLLFISSMIAWKTSNSPFYGYFAVLQAAFYLMALLGWQIARKNRHPGVFYLPFYFVFMNFCVFMGFKRFLTGNQASIWRKALRHKI
jgi:poly-beta-1,6-N-acetyl-D-glucosamine synthase